MSELFRCCAMPAAQPRLLAISFEEPGVGKVIAPTLMLNGSHKVERVYARAMKIADSGVEYLTIDMTTEITQTEANLLEREVSVTVGELNVAEQEAQRLARASAIVGGLALLAGAISAYEGYRVAISTKDINDALAQAGLGCVATVPLLLFGVEAALPMVFLSCAGSAAGAIVGIGRVLVERSVPAVILKAEGAEIKTMLGGLLRGFGGGTSLEALLAHAVDPLTASALYKKAYEKVFGSEGLKELNTIEERLKKIEGELKQLRSYFVVGEDGRIVKMEQVMRELDSVKKKINGLDEDMRNLLYRVGVLEGKAVGYDQDIKSLKNKVKTLSDSVSQLDSKLSTLKTQEIPRLKQKVDNLNKEVGNLSKDITTLETKFNERTDEVENIAYSGLGTALLSFAGLTALSSRLSEIEKKVPELEQALKSKVDVKDFQAFADFTSAINSEVQTLNDRLSKLEAEVTNISSAGLTSAEAVALESGLLELEETVNDCCLPLSYEEAEDDTGNVLNKLKPLRRLGRFAPLINKLLHGGLVPSPMGVPSEFMNVVSVLGLGYGALVNALAYLLV